MSIFSLYEIYGMVDAISVIAGVSRKAYLKFSKEMLSITVTTTPPAPLCILALQMFPHFFTQYFYPRLRYAWIYIDALYPLMFDMERSGFRSLTFSFPQQHHAYLSFQTPHGHRQEHKLQMFSQYEPMDVDDFDCSSFVSLHSVDYNNLVVTMNNFAYVYVTLTDSYVKFYRGTIEIIFHKEIGQCIIGGVERGHHIQFLITLNPIAPLYSMALRSKRVWLFRSKNSFRGVIIAPIGLYIRFFVCFSLKNLKWPLL